MKILPVVTIGGKQYFMDERLRQYRLVTDPFEFVDFVEFREEEGSRIESICFHERFTAEVGCPDCRFTDTLATAVREDLQ